MKQPNLIPDALRKAQQVLRKAHYPDTTREAQAPAPIKVLLDKDQKTQVPLYTGHAVVHSALFEGLRYPIQRWFVEDAALEPAQAFLAVVEDDSMGDVFSKGDLVIGRLEETFQAGEIYAIQMTNRLFIRRISEADGFIQLDSDNALYPDMILPRKKNYRIIGRVLGLLM